VSVPWRFTDTYWHDDIPDYVVVVSYWRRPWKELFDDHRRIRRGEDPVDHDRHRPCTVRLRRRWFIWHGRTVGLVFTVHGLVPARKKARELLAIMADLASPTILASARVNEGIAPLTGWGALPAHYMDFLRYDLSLPASDCGCEGQCRCTVRG
jgi:hypothetical protein